ncbi:hypothetical protein AX17_000816 [Amanita inopinata Kibby_2008]|nr:hypothetical protein AX17_000816 [Amanita inopinata Kibby_2008]
MALATCRTPLLENSGMLASYESADEHDRSIVISVAVTSDGIAPKISGRLYISHFLSTWNSRVFEFGATLFLATIFPRTLLPTSVYALARALSAILFSPVVGRYIDLNNRLDVVRLSIIIQRFSVAASCIIFWYMLTAETTLKSFLLAVVALLACAEKLCSIMNTISIERDWVVVIAGDNEFGLRALNSQMRRIDLFCKLMGPFAISLLDGLSTRTAILATLSLNVAPVAIEYYAIAKVYGEVPALHVPRKTLGLYTLASSPTEPSIPQGNLSYVVSRIEFIAQSFFKYLNHPVFLPSMALSLLYFTVLSFSGQMVTYLLSVGFKATHIAVARIIAVAFEISATWLAPFAMSKVGPIRAGLWFINWQAIWVAIVSALFVGLESPILATSGLVGGVIVSRVGLWGFDLCAQVIIQEEVEADYRGSFSSTEASLQNFFELCSYICTIIFSRPEQFRYPVLMSPVAIYIAGGLFANFVKKRRGHLLHIPSCIKAEGWAVNQPWYQEEYDWERLSRSDPLP